jgi:uncharacterized glyoxalase superfamily protein PhnB
MNLPGQALAPRSSPALRYRNIENAVKWLGDAFGFQEHDAVSDAHGDVSYAEVSFGNTIIMLGATRGFEVDELMRQPDEIGGAETQGSYYFISDIDAHYARACSAGAQIVLALKTHANGARGYTCRDPEGHLWTFGTYDPWERSFSVGEPVGPRAGTRKLRTDASILFSKRLTVAVSIPAVLGFIMASIYGSSWETSREAAAAPTAIIVTNQPEAQQAVAAARRLLAFQRAARSVAERASVTARQEADRERGLRVSAEQMAHELAGQLASAEQEHLLAVNAANAAQQQLNEERNSAAAKLRFSALALADERSAKETSARAASEAQAQLSNVANAKAAADEALRQTRARLVFVSEGARKSTREALEDIQKRMAAEQASRVAAERATQVARDELARERAAKESALQTVAQLKKRLASLEGKSSTESPPKANLSASPKVPKAVATKKAVSQKAPPKEPAATAGGWDFSYNPSY